MGSVVKQSKQSPNRYGKRPLWQWVVLYVIIGGLLYGLVYYFAFAQHSHYGLITKQPSSSASQAMTPVNTGSIYTIKTDRSNNMYLTDAQGMALYVSDGDTAGSGMSNCTDICASNWPPYISDATTKASLPTNITLITRPDGSIQFAWKGKPLYFFAEDMRAGQTSGDGINGFHLAR